MKYAALLCAVALAACQPDKGPVAAPSAPIVETAPAEAKQISFTGTWTQQSVECADGAAPADPVIELRFDTDGRYFVTFVPFETYHDYWGAARFDAATGKLDLDIENANNKPADLDLSGAASLSADGRLTLDEVFLGDRKDHAPPAKGPCRYVFARP